MAFDLSPFPVVLPNKALPGEADHTTRARLVCEGAAQALQLKAPLALDAFKNYASTSYCGTGENGPEAEYRVRVLGIGNGLNAKKNIEYLAVSFLALDAQGNVVGWSEDLHKLEGGREFWRAVNKGLEPPKAKKSAKDCALLTFVTGPERTPVTVTPELRALVEQAVGVAEQAPEKKPGKKAAKRK